MATRYVVSVTIEEVTEGTLPPTDRNGRPTSPGEPRRVVDVARVVTTAPSESAAIDKAIRLLEVELGDAPDPLLHYPAPADDDLVIHGIAKRVVGPLDA